MQRVLVVDDDALFRNALVRDFRNRGCNTEAASTVEEAVAAVRSHKPDLAVVDLRLEQRSGFEVLEKVRAARPEVRVVMLTGYGTIPLAVQALQLGAVNFLSKPISAEQIIEAVRPDKPPTDSLARVEWDYLRRAVDACDGNVSEAARCLRIHRRSLQRKLRKRPPST
jgi:two-component system response regulator RegA